MRAAKKLQELTEAMRDLSDMLWADANVRTTKHLSLAQKKDRAERGEFLVQELAQLTNEFNAVFGKD